MVCILCPSAPWRDLCSRTGAQVLLACVSMTLVHAAFHASLRGTSVSSVLLPVALSVIFCPAYLVPALWHVFESLLFLFSHSFRTREKRKLHLGKISFLGLSYTAFLAKISEHLHLARINNIKFAAPL